MPTLKKPNKQNTRNLNRQDRQKIYQSSKWQKLRAIYLMYHPLCEVCLSKGKITPGAHIHHLDSFLNYEGNERLQKAFDTDNLITLCEECHNHLHLKEGTTRDTNKEQLINRLL